MNDPVDNSGKPPEPQDDDAPASQSQSPHDHPALADADAADDRRKVSRWLVQATDRKGEQVEREYDAGSREEAILIARTEGLRPIDAVNRSALRRRALLAVGVSILLVVAIAYVTRDGLARREFIQQRQAELQAEFDAISLPTATPNQADQRPLPDESVAGTGWTITTLREQLPETEGWQWTQDQGPEGGDVQLVSHPDIPHMNARAKVDGQTVQEFWVAAQMPHDPNLTHSELLKEVKMRISEAVSIAAMVAGADRAATLEWSGDLLGAYAGGQTDTESDSRHVNRHVMQIAITEGTDGVLFVAGVTAADAEPSEGMPIE